MDSQEEVSKQRFNSASKVIKVVESKSTSLSSSSSETSSKRFNTDTKYPKTLVSRKKKNSIIQRNHKDRTQDHQILTVQQEGQQQDKNQKSDNQRKLPHFTIFNDRRQFNEKGKHGQKNTKYELIRCKSVGTLRLPRVVEEKKQEQESKRHISKLNSLLDKNEFNLRKNLANSMHFQSSENIEMFQMYNKNFQETEVIAEIGEIEESKESKVLLADKSIIGNELQKIIVDQIDEKKRYREQREQPVIESIMQQRNDDEVVDEQLRSVLNKLQEEKDFIKKMLMSEIVRSDVIPIQNENISLVTECIKQENEGQNEN